MRSSNRNLLTYQVDRFAEDGASRERMQSGHDTSEQFHDFPITTSDITERSCLLLQHSRNGFDRVAILELLCEGVTGQRRASLRLVVM